MVAFEYHSVHGRKPVGRANFDDSGIHFYALLNVRYRVHVSKLEIA
jgi:hypothetical protein